MGFIDGVGGAFVFSHDPKRLANWYADNLGLAFEGSDSAGAYYLTFWSLDPDDPTRRLDTHFSIIRAQTPMNRPVPQPEPESMYGDQPFMVNLRTRDLDALVANLESRGVAILKRENEPYGKFAWIRDADGNRVELYQPLQAVPS